MIVITLHLLQRLDLLNEKMILALPRLRRLHKQITRIEKRSDIAIQAVHTRVHTNLCSQKVHRRTITASGTTANGALLAPIGHKLATPQLQMTIKMKIQQT